MNNFGWLKVFFMFVIVFALQMTIADWLSFFDVAPDFVIIFIVAVPNPNGNRVFSRFGARNGSLFCRSEKELLPCGADYGIILYW